MTTVEVDVTLLAAVAVGILTLIFVFMQMSRDGGGAGAGAGGGSDSKAAAKAAANKKKKQKKKAKANGSSAPDTSIRLYKEVYPALCDADFGWMKSTRGALVITGDDEKDIETPHAKVHRLKTEEALQKFIEGRQLVNTTVIRWFNIYADIQYDTLFAGC